MQFSFDLKRDHLEQNDEKKTDQEMCIEWLKAAYASSQTQADPLLHLLWNSLLQRLAAAKGGSIELSKPEHMMVLLTLARANFNAAGNSVYCQLLKKVGIELE